MERASISRVKQESDYLYRRDYALSGSILVIICGACRVDAMAGVEIVIDDALNQTSLLYMTWFDKFMLDGERTDCLWSYSNIRTNLLWKVLQLNRYVKQKRAECTKMLSLTQTEYRAAISGQEFPHWKREREKVTSTIKSRNVRYQNTKIATLAASAKAYQPSATSTITNPTTLLLPLHFPKEPNILQITHPNPFLLLTIANCC